MANTGTGTAFSVQKVAGKRICENGVRVEYNYTDSKKRKFKQVFTMRGK